MYAHTVHYNRSTNLPIFFTSTNLENTPVPQQVSTSVAAFLSSTTHTTNLSPIQQKLLHKHQQMGHLHMHRIQDLARQGYFGTANKSLANP
jgi:hypothetical protein